MKTSARRQKVGTKAISGDLSPSENVNATPEEKAMAAAVQSLRKKLKKYEEGLQFIADCDPTLERLKKEVQDHFDKVNPLDDAAMQQAESLVSGKRAQIKMIPNFKEGEEYKQDERGKALCDELDATVKTILACAGAEMECRLSLIEKAVRPWFPPYRLPADRLHALPERTFDPARTVAAGSALLMGGLHFDLVFSPWQRPSAGRLHNNPANVASYDRELTGRAEKLLGIYQAWEENGWAFLTYPLPLPVGTTQEAQETPQAAVGDLAPAEVI